MRIQMGARTLVRVLVLTILLLIVGRQPDIAAAEPLKGGGCPNFRAIGNFKISNVVGASVSMSSPTQATYTLDTTDRGSTSGVPGLIAYCVYVAPASLPDSATAVAQGANALPFQVILKAVQGFFAFERNNGNPSNFPLNGAIGIEVGTASWNAGTPTPQTILLHINDASECQSLYNGSSETCFVFPGLEETPPPR